MNRKKFWLVSVFVLWIMLALNLAHVQAQTPGPVVKQVDEKGTLELELQTVDHFVPHISTLPVNLGEEVQLFVRERFLSGDEKKNGKFYKDKCSRKGPAVLFLEGLTTPAIPVYDTNFEDYAWMSYLAENCFDVFAMDFQGYGMSNRPKEMDDPCNASISDQKDFLIPNPLKATCAASYSKPIQSLDGFKDEIDSVINYIRELRKDEKLQINMIGWSRGGLRAIAYTADHPDKIEKLVLLSPGHIPPVTHTVALKVVDRGAIFNAWDSMLDKKNCPDTFDPAIRDVIWNQILAGDELGSAWGKSGVMRSPGIDTSAWNSTLPTQITVPTIIVRGVLDTIADELSIQQLYANLGATDKVLLTVNCATHSLAFEKKHAILLDASLQWLSSGTYDGSSWGSFVK